MSELKPVKCGCGGEARAVFPFMHTDMYLIECNKCGICTSSYDTETEAVKAWNRAMGNVQKMHDPLVHCKDCKHYAEDVFAYADHTTIIVAHGACKVWGGSLGSKTDPGGWCYLGVRKEDNDGDQDEKA